jgi:hypothetical protein
LTPEEINLLASYNHAQVTVHFSTVEEFLEEIRAGRPNIEPIVRATKMFEQSKQFPPLQYVSVVATALRHTPPIVQLIKLVRYCGDYHGKGFSDGTIKKADAELTMIEQGAGELNLEVRAGIYK